MLTHILPSLRFAVGTHATALCQDRDAANGCRWCYFCQRARDDPPNGQDICPGEGSELGECIWFLQNKHLGNGVKFECDARVGASSAL